LECYGESWIPGLLTPSTLKNEQNGQDLSSTENGSIARVGETGFRGELVAIRCTVVRNCLCVLDTQWGINFCETSKTWTPTQAYQGMKKKLTVDGAEIPCP